MQKALRRCRMCGERLDAAPFLNIIYYSQYRDALRFSMYLCRECIQNVSAKANDLECTWDEALIVLATLRLRSAIRSGLVRKSSRPADSGRFKFLLQMIHKAASDVSPVDVIEDRQLWRKTNEIEKFYVYLSIVRRYCKALRLRIDLRTEYEWICKAMETCAARRLAVRHVLDEIARGRTTFSPMMGWPVWATDAAWHLLKQKGMEYYSIPVTVRKQWLDGAKKAAASRRRSDHLEREVLNDPDAWWNQTEDLPNQKQSLNHCT